MTGPRHYVATAYKAMPDGDGHELTAYGIELALELRSDYGQDDLLELARRRTGWSREQWDERIDELCNLHDEILEATVTGEHARRRCAEQEHADALEALARGPLQAAVDQALAVVGPAPKLADELARKRGER